MTEEEALSQCNNWVNLPPLIGYFPFGAANFLVGTGKYKFQQAGWMGYVLEKINKPKPSYNKALNLTKAEGRVE